MWSFNQQKMCPIITSTDVRYRHYWVYRETLYLIFAGEWDDPQGNKQCDSIQQDLEPTVHKSFGDEDELIGMLASTASRLFIANI